MLNPRDLAGLFSEGTVEKVLAKAQKLSAKGRNDQASQVLKEAIGRLGESPELRLELAAIALSENKPRDAAESLRALLKAEPGQVPRVEEFIGLARTQHADVEALYEPLAEGLVARRNYTAALDWLEKIQRKTLEGLVEARLTNLNRFLEKGAAVPRGAVPTLYMAALGYEATANWQRAMECYRKILAAVPTEFNVVEERMRNLVGRNYKTTPLRLQYAEVLQAQGHPDRALEENLKAVEVDNRCAPQARKYLEERLAAAPGDAALLWCTVKVDMAAGKTPEALETCGRLADAGERLSDIETLLEEIAGGGKETVDTQLLMARVATAQGKASRAVAAVVAALGQEAGERGAQALERLVEAFPGESRPLQLLADLHLREGRMEACLEAFRKLRGVDPASSPAIATRLQALLAADPSNASARELLEEVCVESGDPKGAVPFLRRRLRENPSKAGEILEKLRALRIAQPGDRGLALAAAEAALSGGDAAGAWVFLQELIREGDGPVAEPAVLHLLVMAAGGGVELWQGASTYIAGKTPSWMSRPEVVFALAEAAGRAGLLSEAVAGYRTAAAAAPEGASVCRDAVRALARGAAAAAPAEKAALAEALAGIDELPAAIEVLRGISDLAPGSSSRLIARLNERLRRDPKNLELIACVAQVCLASGQTARALEVSRAGLTGREDAASAPLALTYGDALCLTGRLNDAVRAYAAAASRDPALAQETIERLRAALQLDSGLESARLTLGRLLMHEGHVEQGVRDLMAAWSARPDLAASILKDLDRAARRHAGDTMLDLARARLLASLGRAAEAAELAGGAPMEDAARMPEVISLLEEMADRHPDAARAHLELARACARQGWVPRACAALARAHALDRSLEGAARICLAQLEQAFPADPLPRLGRAAIEEAAERWLPAAEALAEAASLKGLKAAEALRALARIAATPGVPGRVHLLHARASRLADQTEACVGAARAALESDAALATELCYELDRLLERGPHAAALLVRAEGRLRLQDLESAARDLHEALSRGNAEIARLALVVARELAARQPGKPLAAMALSRALEASGDLQAAATSLDEAIASGGSSDVALLLDRRRLALAMRDAGRAADLLAQAERAAPSRERLLALLHDEALFAQGPDPSTSPVEAAIRAADYARAAALLAPEGPSLRLAWVLERCGRAAEAAACLDHLASDERAARRSAALHDRVASRLLIGKQPALMAEALLALRSTASRKEKARVAPARLTAKGGVA